MIPIIFVFENHALPVGRECIMQYMQTIINNKGTCTLAYEISSNFTLTTMLSTAEQNLQTANANLSLVKQRISQGHFPPNDNEINKMKIKIYGLPSLIKLLRFIENNKLEFIGIDKCIANDFEDFKKINPSAQDSIRDERESVMTNNLFNLALSGKRIIALLGLNHVKGIQKKLHHLSPELAKNSIYTFPYNDEFNKQKANSMIENPSAITFLDTNQESSKDFFDAIFEKNFRNAAADGRVNILKGLLKIIPNINIQDNSLRTALHWAILNNKTECAQVLIAAGAKYDIYDAAHKTAFMYAKELKRQEILAKMENQQEQPEKAGEDSLLLKNSVFAAQNKPIGMNQQELNFYKNK